MITSTVVQIVGLKVGMLRSDERVNKDGHYSGILIHTEDLTYQDDLKRWPRFASEFVVIFVDCCHMHISSLK